MPGIIFSINDIILELECAKGLAGRFLVSHEAVFSRLRVQLESLREEASRSDVAWEISPSQALRTIVSEGQYESSGKGKPVFGTLSFRWEVRRIHPKKLKQPARYFQLVGIASTTTRVFEVNDDGSQGKELAMWRTEVGDDNSPGCHFHVQIRGEDDEGPFPKRLSVPRLPGYLATPMAALEFMLAELFQERWKKHVVAETDDLKRWRAIQKRRFEKLLGWQTETISRATQSPWSVLKAAKPPERLFVD
jgi:hypothetical protein